jgi:hypothetical protein
MDQLEALREKVVRLRAEIALIQESNERYRRHSRNDVEAQVAHGRRLERLLAIQAELAQLAIARSKVRSVEDMKERHRARLFVFKQAS